MGAGCIFRNSDYQSSRKASFEPSERFLGSSRPPASESHSLSICRIELAGCRFCQDISVNGTIKLSTHCPGGSFRHQRTAEVLLVSHRLHPVSVFTLDRFGDGEVRHRSRFSSAMPVAFSACTGDDITRPDLGSGASLALRPSDTCQYDESLTCRM